MSARIIDLAARRPAKPEPPPPGLDLPEMYCIRMVKGGTDEMTGELLGLEGLTPDQQRLIASDLIALSRALMLAAYERDGNRDHNVVGEYRVMASGRLTGWTSPQVDTPEKLDWLAVTVTGLAGTVPTFPGA